MATGDLGTLRARVELDDKMSAGLHTAEGSLNKFSDTVKATALGMIGANGLEQAISTVVSVIKSSITNFVDLEESMSRVKGLSGANEIEFQKMQSSVHDLSLSLGIDQNSLAKSLYSAYEATNDTTDALKLLDVAAKASAIGLGDTSSIVNLLDTVLDSFNLTANDSTDVMNKMLSAAKTGETSLAGLGSALSTVGPLAGNAGLSFEETAAALSSMTKKGISSEQAAMSLQAILIELLDSNSKLSKFIGMDGVKSAGDFAKALELMKEKTGGSAAVIQQLIPGARTLKGALELAKGGAETFTTSITDMNKGLDEMNKRLDIAESTHKMAWAKIGSYIGLAKESLGSFTVDALDSLIESVGLFAKTSGGIISDIKNWATGTDELEQLLHKQNKTIEEGFKIIDLAREKYNKLGEGHEEEKQKLESVMTLTGKFIELKQKESTQVVATAKVTDKADKNKEANALAQLNYMAQLEESRKGSQEATTKYYEQESKDAKEAADIVKKLEDEKYSAFHDARVADYNEQLETYQAIMNDEKSTYEQKLKAVVDYQNKKLEMINYEGTYQQNLLDQEYDAELKTLELKGLAHGKALNDLEIKYSEKSAAIETNWSTQVTKELEITAKATIEMKQDMWDKLSANVAKNFTNWSDELKKGSTTAWSGLISDSTQAIGAIGDLFGGMSDQSSKVINDLGNDIIAIFSGNPIQMAVAGLHTVMDLLGIKSQAAAEAEERAAVEANKAAQAFLESQGKENLALKSYEELEAMSYDTLEQMMKKLGVGQNAIDEMITSLKTTGKFQDKTTQEIISSYVDYAAQNPDLLFRQEGERLSQIQTRMGTLTSKTQLSESDITPDTSWEQMKEIINAIYKDDENMRITKLKEYAEKYWQKIPQPELKEIKEMTPSTSGITKGTIKPSTPLNLEEPITGGGFSGINLSPIQSTTSTKRLDVNVKVDVTGETGSAQQVGEILADRLEVVFRSQGVI